MTRRHSGPSLDSRAPLLAAFGIFGASQDVGLERVSDLAAETFGAAVTTLAFVADDRYVLKASRGLVADDLPREWHREHPEFLSNTVLWQGDLGAEDRHPCFGMTPAPRFAASSPILCPEGRVLGRLIVMDPTPRPEPPTALERRALAAFGTLASREVAPSSPTRYRAIFDDSPAVMWLLDPVGLGFRLVNHAATAKLGWSQEELATKTLADIVDGSLAPSFRSHPSGIMRLKTRDGHRLTAELSGREIDLGGGPQLLVVANDVTERRLVEAALTNSREALRRVLLQRTATLDALPIDVALIDEAGRIMFVNRTWRNFAETGYFPDGGNMIGGDYIQICRQNPLLYGGHGSDVAAAVEEVLAGSRAALELEVPFETARGVRWFRLMVTPVSAGGRRDGAVILHIDMTEAKRAAAAIEAANQLKSQFLANTSHELRTPLNAVIGFSELIKLQAFGLIGDRYLEYVDYIHASGHHLLEIINDLLDLSKIEAGQMSLNEEEVGLRDLAEECVDFLKIRMTSGKLQYSLNIGPELGMRCDRLRMKQILLNLLSNAVKFTPEGGHIEVVARIGDDGGIRLEIVDTGIGMDEEGARLALEPFVQIASSGGRRSEGTGLGLSLVNRLIGLHGGTIEIDSKLGHGTTVRVALPADRTLTVTPD